MGSQNNTIPFSIQKKDVVLVKPSIPTPSTVLSFSSIDNDPNIEHICQTIYVYRAGNNIPPNANSDPVNVLQQALSKVLVYYYPLAGKLKRASDGKLQLIYNHQKAGVPFVEAIADCKLSSLGYFDGIDAETPRYFVYHQPSRKVVDDDDDGYHPLVFQVTKFSCGGFTIGMGLSHSVCDGFGAGQFFHAMAELASGKNEPSVKPIWERERLVGKSSQDSIPLPLDKNSVASSPHLPSNEVIQAALNIKSGSVGKLKSFLMKESIGSENFTLIEALGAYIWRSRARALELTLDGKTMFSLAVGVRKTVNLPGGYYGNAFVSAHVAFLVRDLVEKPLSDVAKMIRESKNVASRPEYVAKSLNYLETVRELDIKMGSNGAGTILTDWRRLNLLEEVDFGWKGAVNIIPVSSQDISGYVDLCLLLPPCSLDDEMRGGVRVLVCLPRVAMDKFKQEMNALDNLGDETFKKESISV